MSLVVPLLVAAASICTVPTDEKAMQLSLPYATFDSRGGPYGWRNLNASGCTDAAVSLLAAYSGANTSRLAGVELREIAFHIGQALAMAGREQEAIAHFEKAQDAGASAEWRAYVQATLAFLRRDAAGLATARETYAAIAPGSMRLRIIDGFVACSGEPYAKAAHCKM
jgi:hypothetical protein